VKSYPLIFVQKAQEIFYNARNAGGEKDEHSTSNEKQTSTLGTWTKQLS